MFSCCRTIAYSVESMLPYSNDVSKDPVILDSLAVEEESPVEIDMMYIGF